MKKPETAQIKKFKRQIQKAISDEFDAVKVIVPANASKEDIKKAAVLQFMANRAMQKFASNGITFVRAGRENLTIDSRGVVKKENVRKQSNRNR